MQALKAALDYSRSLARYARRFPEILDDAAPGPTDDFNAQLRWQRNRELIRILARDLAGEDFSTIARDISDLASRCLDAAVQHHGGDADFVALGMGKLGGRELNYSSDIDLLYIYRSDEGTTEVGLTPHEHFSRVAARVGETLGEPTGDGIVWRVDLDLRPEGRSGPAVNGLASALRYYENWGQTWERFALLKARPVAGDMLLGAEFLKEVRPFVFRRTLDYTTLDAIREMKRRIGERARHVRPSAGFDVKLGTGGIRELEFVVQALVLIHGGRVPSVQVPGTLAALDKLTRANILSAGDRDELSAAYRFLRTLEHRIQAVELAQVHELPTDAEELAHIAKAGMGLSSVDELESALAGHCRVVVAAFNELFDDPEDAAPASPELAALMTDPYLSEADERELIGTLRLEDPAAVQRTFARIRRRPRGRSEEASRKYLRRISPVVYDELSQSADPDAALRNLEGFLSRIGAWTTLLALLAENPETTRTLMKLFGSSNYLSGLFITHPELLDQLVRTGSGTTQRGRRELRAELSAIVQNAEDFELRLDALRRWRHAEMLRVGLADLSGKIPVEIVSRQLSEIADAVVGAALCAAHGGPLPSGFLIVALGGLGGRELVFASDLDLIFFYDPDKLSREEGTKLGQRVITALSSPTGEGIAFRVDLRLRPSGMSGPLITSADAFRSYHETGAALWERLALVRARAVAGDPALWSEARPLVHGAVFKTGVEADVIAEEVISMRERLEKEIARERGAKYNLKTGRGGLVDIEFIVQFLQLVYGAARPTVRSPNTLKGVRRLTSEGLISKSDGRLLEEAYRFLRLLENRLRIVQDRPETELPREEEHADRLARRARMGGSGRQLLSKYEEMTGRVRETFDSILWQKRSSS